MADHRLDSVAQNKPLGAQPSMSLEEAARRAEDILKSMEKPATTGAPKPEEKKKTWKFMGQGQLDELEKENY